MKKHTYSLLLIPFFILISSCQSEQPAALLPTPSGRPGEVLVVMDKHLIESDLGTYLIELMGQPFEVIPQYEPIYDMIPIPSTGFNKIFRSHRNIFMIKISPDYTRAKIIVQRDTWARHQLLVNIAGPDKASVLEELKNNDSRLIDLLNHAERSRTIENYKKNRAKGIDALLRENHGVSISVPAGYTLAVDSSDFVWLAHEVADMIQGVLIYYYDYADPNTFTKEYLLGKRNEMTRQFVPGSAPNSYMVVEDRAPVQMREMSRDSTYVIELRGLWKMEHAFMGGPFLSLTSLDEEKNRVVTVEGFVHAPSLDKRNYVRELEAILHTFKVID